MIDLICMGAFLGLPVVVVLVCMAVLSVINVVEGVLDHDRY